MARGGDEGYPVISVKNWWTLRSRFKVTIPSQVTTNYLASVLNINEASARAAVVPYLSKFGIIDEEGRPTERARAWRDDQQYARVCSEIVEEIYSDLHEAWPGPEIDRDAVQRWFGNRTGAGKSHLQKMAAVYQLLVEADPTKGQERQKPKRESEKTRPRSTVQPRRRTAEVASASENLAISAENNGGSPRTQASRHVLVQPSLHFNVQVHISEKASLEQIEKMFESMARHLAPLYQPQSDD